jgi:hypothetical protein
VLSLAFFGSVASSAIESHRSEMLSGLPKRHKQSSTGSSSVSLG